MHFIKQTLSRAFSVDLDNSAFHAYGKTIVFTVHIVQPTKIKNNFVCDKEGYPYDDRKLFLISEWLSGTPSIDQTHPFNCIIIPTPFFDSSYENI